MKILKYSIYPLNNKNILGLVSLISILIINSKCVQKNWSN